MEAVAATLTRHRVRRRGEGHTVLSASMSPAHDTVVFIPAWNEEANLPSVLAKLAATIPDTDVLVIDDGSTDDTAAVAEQLSAEDRRIRVIRQPNGGPGAARRDGVRCMRWPRALCPGRPGPCG